MFAEKRILAPIDFSPCSPEVVEAAERLAETEQCGLVLLHVIEPLEARYQRPPAIMSSVLEDYAALIRRIPRDKVRVIVLEGHPVETILDAAIACRCHAIVMGRGGQGHHHGLVASGIRKLFRGDLKLIMPALNAAAV